ncbi:hypothetical protein HAX54_040589 [Datura stramonium]|uniref:Uncharacterized protein n=1 Tax=Datura stramonium TaxID=4076 RepID=A0ABS8SKI9_DATST|nr:hypothetical protein [Datura stramonium]
MSMPAGLQLATDIPLDLMTSTKKPPKENYVAKLATILMPAQASTPVYAKKKTFKGKSTIFFKANDYYGVMKDKCRLTLVGKFSARRPKLEKIQTDFKAQFSVIGMDDEKEPMESKSDDKNAKSLIHAFSSHQQIP